MRSTKCARILAVGIAFVTALGMLPLVAASDIYDNSTVQITVEDSGYPMSISPSQKWFVPEDTIDLTIQVTVTAVGLQDFFDILIFGQGETLYAEHVIRFNDVAVDHATGKATVTIPSIMTEALPDDNYDVYVGDEMWIQDKGFDSGRIPWDWTWFRVQMYTIIAETDRTGYIPGDPVTVFYSVVSIKDGSLITEDAYDGSSFDGQWNVESGDGETTEGPTSFSNSAGNFDFQIFPQGSVSSTYFIYIYFNGTYGSTREQATRLQANAPGPDDFTVGGLGMSVTLDRAPPEYQLDSIVRVDVRTMVEGSNAGEPDVDVEIDILEGIGPSADKIFGYGGDFYSDADGEVHYMFQLDDGDFDEGQIYTVRVNTSKWLKEAWLSRVFSIVSGSGVISVDMVFNRDEYTTGDTVNIMVNTAAPAGHSTDFTYIYTVSSETSAYAKEAGSSSLFSFNLPSNFEGEMYFEVEVYNADRDHGYDLETKNVKYGIMLVNVDRDEYNAGDVLTVDYELISVLMPPDFFYVIRDANGNIVYEDVLPGSASWGYFTFNVPIVPSSSYTFNVYACEDGRILSGSDSADLEIGYDLIISFDKSNYLAGEIAVVHYEIVIQGGAGWPASFDLRYALYDYAPRSLATDHIQGDLSYPIPSGIPDGSYVFVLEEFVTGTVAVETITIGSVDPITGMPDFDGDGVPDSADSDDDNDGYSDVIEEEEGSNPKNATSKPPDTDEDYIPDSMDVDDDNDGFSDGEELLAGSDPMSSTSVPQAEETDPATSNPWEWLTPLILAVIALVMATIVLIRSGRPPRKEALLDDADTTEIDDGPSQ